MAEGSGGPNLSGYLTFDISDFINKVNAASARMDTFEQKLTQDLQAMENNLTRQMGEIADKVKPLTAALKELSQAASPKNTRDITNFFKAINEGITSMHANAGKMDDVTKNFNELSTAIGVFSQISVEAMRAQVQSYNQTARANENLTTRVRAESRKRVQVSEAEAAELIAQARRLAHELGATNKRGGVAQTAVDDLFSSRNLSKLNLTQGAKPEDVIKQLVAIRNTYDRLVGEVGKTIKTADDRIASRLSGALVYGRELSAQQEKLQKQTQAAADARINAENRIQKAQAETIAKRERAEEAARLRRERAEEAELRRAVRQVGGGSTVPRDPFSALIVTGNVAYSALDRLNGGLSRLSGTLTSLGQVGATVAYRLMILNAPLIAIGKNALESSLEIEQSVRYVGTQLDRFAGETQTQFMGRLKQLEAGLIEMSRTVPVKVADLIQGAFFVFGTIDFPDQSQALVEMGQKVGLQMTETIGRVAAATRTEVKTVADAGLSVLNVYEGIADFGLPAMDKLLEKWGVSRDLIREHGHEAIKFLDGQKQIGLANEYADSTSQNLKNVYAILFETVRVGKVEFSDLATNIGRVAEFARRAKIDLPELAAIIAVESKAFSRTQTFTFTQNMLKALSDPTRLAAMQDLGIAVTHATDMTGKAIELTGKDTNLLRMNTAEVKQNEDARDNQARSVSRMTHGLERSRNDLSKVDRTLGQNIQKWTSAIDSQFNNAVDKIGRQLGKTLGNIEEKFRESSRRLRDDFRREQSRADEDYGTRQKDVRRRRDDSVEDVRANLAKSERQLLRDLRKRIAPGQEDALMAIAPADMLQLPVEQLRDLAERLGPEYAEELAKIDDDLADSLEKIQRERNDKFADLSKDAGDRIGDALSTYRSPKAKSPDQRGRSAAKVARDSQDSISRLDRDTGQRVADTTDAYQERLANLLMNASAEGKRIKARIEEERIEAAEREAEIEREYQRQMIREAEEHERARKRREEDFEEKMADIELQYREEFNKAHELAAEEKRLAQERHAEERTLLAERIATAQEEARIRKEELSNQISDLEETLAAAEEKLAELEGRTSLKMLVDYEEGVELITESGEQVQVRVRAGLDILEDFVNRYNALKKAGNEPAAEGLVKAFFPDIRQQIPASRLVTIFSEVLKHRKRFRESFAEETSAMNNAITLMFDATLAKLGILDNNWRAFAVNMFEETIGPVLRKFVDRLGELFKALEKLGPESKQFISEFLIKGIAAVPLILAVATFVTVLGELAAIVAALASPGGLFLLAAVLPSIGKLFKEVNEAANLLGDDGLTKVAGLVVGLLDAFGRKEEAKAFRDFFSGLGADLSKVDTKEFRKEIKDVKDKLLETVDAIKKMGEAIYNFVTFIYEHREELKFVALLAGLGMISNALSGIVGLATRAGQALTGLASAQVAGMLVKSGAPPAKTPPAGGVPAVIATPGAPSAKAPLNKMQQGLGIGAALAALTGGLWAFGEATSPDSDSSAVKALTTLGLMAAIPILAPMVAANPPLLAGLIAGGGILGGTQALHSATPMNQTQTTNIPVGYMLNPFLGDPALTVPMETRAPSIAEIIALLANYGGSRDLFFQPVGETGETGIAMFLANLAALDNVFSNLSEVGQEYIKETVDNPLHPQFWNVLGKRLKDGFDDYMNSFKTGKEKEKADKKKEELIKENAELMGDNVATGDIAGLTAGSSSYRPSTTNERAWQIWAESKAKEQEAAEANINAALRAGAAPDADFPGRTDADYQLMLILNNAKVAPKLASNYSDNFFSSKNKLFELDKTVDGDQWQRYGNLLDLIGFQAGTIRNRLSKDENADKDIALKKELESLLDAAIKPEDLQDRIDAVLKKYRTVSYDAIWNTNASTSIREDWKKNQTATSEGIADVKKTVDSHQPAVQGAVEKTTNMDNTENISEDHVANRTTTTTQLTGLQKDIDSFETPLSNALATTLDADKSTKIAEHHTANITTTDTKLTGLETKIGDHTTPMQGAYTVTLLDSITKPTEVSNSLQGIITVVNEKADELWRLITEKGAKIRSGYRTWDPPNATGSNPTALPSRVALWKDAVRIQAEKHGVPVDLALALMATESGGNENARSPVGAIGLMQLMPGTAAGLGVDPHDPAQNIEGGVRYLRQMLDLAGGDVRMALAMYNAGPGMRGKPESEWYAETKQHVSKTLNYRQSAADVFSAPGGIREQIMQKARSQLGDIYRLGARPGEVFDAFGKIRELDIGNSWFDPIAFDCASFINWVFAQIGQKIGITTAEIERNTDPISDELLRPGDLLTFAQPDGQSIGNSRLTHVGIYAGNNRIVHAASEGRGVVEEEMTGDYYRKFYAGARRARGLDAAPGGVTSDIIGAALKLAGVVPPSRGQMIGQWMGADIVDIREALAPTVPEVAESLGAAPPKLPVLNEVIGQMLKDLYGDEPWQQVYDRLSVSLGTRDLSQIFWRIKDTLHPGKSWEEIMGLGGTEPPPGDGQGSLGGAVSLTQGADRSALQALFGKVLEVFTGKEGAGELTAKFQQAFEALSDLKPRTESDRESVSETARSRFGSLLKEGVNLFKNDPEMQQALTFALSKLIFGFTEMPLTGPTAGVPIIPTTGSTPIAASLVNGAAVTTTRLEAATIHITTAHVNFEHLARAMTQQAGVAEGEFFSKKEIVINIPEKFLNIEKIEALDKEDLVNCLTEITDKARKLVVDDITNVVNAL